MSFGIDVLLSYICQKNLIKMNRKFIILIAAMAVSLGVNAQTMKSMLVQENSFKQETINKEVEPRAENISAKTTGSGGTRTINIVDDIYLTSNPDIGNNLAVASMFNDSTANILYSDGSLGSAYLFGAYQIMNPTRTTLNSEVFYPGSIDMGINQSNNLTVDSIALYGFYNRNDMTITDSLILNVTNSSYNDIGLFSWDSSSNPWVFTNYNTDTLRFGDLGYDTLSNEAITSSNIRLAIPMDNAAFADTSATGWHRIVFPVGMSMTNTDLIATAFSFKYMNSWIANDTLNTNLNSWLPRFFEESAGGYPTYIKNETWDITGIATKGSKYGNWLGLYIPSYAYTAPFRLEHADIDYIITCADCEILSIVDRKVNLGTVYPNPASTVINIPMELIEAGNVQVSVVNLIGQEVLTQDFGKMNGHQVLELGTERLQNGLYMVNIMVDGAIAAATKVNIK